MVRRKRLFQPANSARILVGHRRSPASDYLLATILAFVAGAANAGGFFALVVMGGGTLALFGGAAPGILGWLP